MGFVEVTQVLDGGMTALSYINIEHIIKITAASDSSYSWIYTKDAQLLIKESCTEIMSKISSTLLYYASEGKIDPWGFTD